MTLRTKADFDAVVAEMKDTPKPVAYGLGFATYSSTDYRTVWAKSNKVLAVRFRTVNYGGENQGTMAAIAKVMGYTGGAATYVPTEEQLGDIASYLDWTRGDGKVHANLDALVEMRNVVHGGWGPRWGPNRFGFSLPRVPVITVIGTLQDQMQSAMHAYLALHLLSQRRTQPNTINLNGLFGLLTNTAWTNAGPLDPEMVDQAHAIAEANGEELQVYSVDKFPRMTDYVVPSGVRTADADRARLGAYLAPGTTLMHEGFCNFNAGTLGACMVEGRISQGVTVGEGTDIGGGASIMGTLSGGGTEVITIGKKCLLGANSGVGISLGDGCTVEAGLYLTAGMKVRLLGDESGRKWVKAVDLSGNPNMRFWRNSQTGAVEVQMGYEGRVKLNEALHAKQ